MCLTFSLHLEQPFIFVDILSPWFVFQMGAYSSPLAFFLKSDDSSRNFEEESPRCSCETFIHSSSIFMYERRCFEKKGETDKNTTKRKPQTEKGENRVPACFSAGPKKGISGLR